MAEMKKRWLSLARCAETILGNFSVVGLALAIYQDALWPTLAIAAGTALVALLLSWMVPHD